jgi:hypothetical protein
MWQWLAWLVGVLFLGALGSGLWDLFLKPSTLRLHRGLLTFRARIVKGFEDSVYANVAKGFHEHPSVHTFLWSHSLMGVSFLILCICLLASIPFSFRLNEVIARNGALPQTFPSQAPFLSPLPPWLIVSVGIVGAVVCFGFAFQILAFQSGIHYEVLAVAHYKQLRRIVAPCISVTEMLVIDSDFSQIRNREGYQAVIQTLTQLAVGAGKNVPKFDIW